MAIEPKTERLTPEKTAPALLGDRYELNAELGAGGMGRVWRARDRETGEVVAVKLLRPEIAADPAMAERFKNELRVARRITHKNVCRIHDFNRAGDVAYITMEYVEGESLRARLERERRIPFARLKPIAMQILAGLREAHAQGVVHRDLKPENIMLSKSGAVKLMDFGIARLVTATTATQGIIGTPAYMSPEQASGKRVDARTDLYAFGLILYECLTGRPTFSADTPVAVALKQVQEKPTPPHVHVKDLPRHVEAIVLRCLEKDPARRYGTAADLERALRAPEIVAQPVTRRRRPRLLAVVALVLAGVVAHKLVQRHRALSNPPAPVAATATAPVPPAAIAPPARAARVAPPVPAPVPQTSVAAAPRDESPQALYRRGLRYARGDGVAQDDARAVALWQRAAEQGDANAQNALGEAYLNGRGVVPDEQQALRWIKAAAEQDQPDAETRLASMLFERATGREEKMRAVRLWRRAAQQGNAQAQYRLGLLLERGGLVHRNLREAAKLYAAAAAGGNADAQARLDALKARFSERRRERR